jgi:hypothetical protein
VFCDIVVAVSFFFPFPLSLSSTEWIHYCKCSTYEFVYDYACYCVILPISEMSSRRPSYRPDTKYLVSF